MRSPAWFTPRLRAERSSCAAAALQVHDLCSSWPERLSAGSCIRHGQALRCQCHARTGVAGRAARQPEPAPEAAGHLPRATQHNPIAGPRRALLCGVRLLRERATVRADGISGPSGGSRQCAPVRTRLPACVSLLSATSSSCLGGRRLQSGTKHAGLLLVSMSFCATARLSSLNLLDKPGHTQLVPPLHLATPRAAPIASEGGCARRLPAAGSWPVYDLLAGRDAGHMELAWQLQEAASTQQSTPTGAHAAPCARGPSRSSSWMPALPQPADQGGRVRSIRILPLPC